MQVLDAQMNSAWEMMATEAGQVNSWLDRLLEGGFDLRVELEAESPELRDVLETMTDEELESMFRDAFQNCDAVVECLALPYYETQSVDFDTLHSENPMSHLLLDAMANMPAQEAATRAEVRGTMLASALELYALENGAYPNSLEGLVPGYLTVLPEDPFSGQSFGYAPSGSGYVLWSTGPDMRDDGGALLDRTGAFHERKGDILIHGGESLAVE